MFKSLLESGAADVIVEGAVAEALEEEQSGPFAKPLQSIKLFCRAHADQVMVEECKQGLATSYVVYSPSPYKHALFIANEVARSVEGPELNIETSNGRFVAMGVPSESFWVYMYTKMTHTRFEIGYRMRSIATVVRGQMCAKYAVPSSEGLSVPPPEYYLAKTNYRLFSPQDRDEWENLDVEEKKYRNLFSCRIDVLGGASSRKDLRDIAFSALQECDIPDMALAGHWAVNKLTGASAKNDVFTVPIALCEDTQKIVRVLQSVLGTKMESKERMMEIPGFPRLRRHGIYAHDRKPYLVAEVFNVPEYDPVPMSDVKNIAHARVLLFVVYLEVWIKETLCKAMDPVSRATPFCKWAAIMSKHLYSSDHLKKEYKKWIGKYDPIETWLKDRMLAEKRHFPYYPGMWKLKHGSFKSG